MLMKKIVLLLILTVSLGNLFAQMTRPASGFLLNDRYDSSTTLRKADYIVQGEVVFAKTATITIEPGVRIFFSPGASIRVEGSLHILGEANSLVQFSSAGGKESGTGLVIKSNAPESDIKINYASFKFLLKPLSFEKDWYRKNVEITNSEFFNTYEFNDAISIKEVEFYLNKKPIDFVFKYNVFGDNYSNMSVYNATSYLVRYIFEKNVFANNYYFDSRSKAESNPFYVTLDDIQGKFTAKNFDNAFSDNYILSQDSLRLRGHGTVGFIYNKPTFEYLNNYSKNATDKAFSQQNPYAGLHAFSVEMNVDGTILTQYTPVDSLIGKNIKIKFNNPIASQQNEYKVFFNFIDTITGEILKEPVEKYYKFVAGNGTEAEFSFEAPVVTEPISYISIENLKNPDGVSVPSINLGVLDFFEKVGSRNYKMDYVTLMPIDISKSHSVLVDTSKNNIEERDSLEINVGQWEFGVMGGVSGYAGDLNQSWFNQEKYFTNYGVKARYHLNRNISAKFSIDYTKVGATDYGVYGDRKLSFRSSIIAVSALAEYNFSDKYKFNKDDRLFKKRKKSRQKFNDPIEYNRKFSLGRELYPSVGIGLSLVKFNPQGKYTDGKWYDLRPFGLEGQTLPGGKQYGTLIVAIPITGAINYRINNNLKVAFEFTGFKLFTDYLDNASKQAYVDDELIRAANPSNPDVASYFRQPGADLGARGDPTDRDFFYNMGISIWYRFSKKK